MDSPVDTPASPLILLTGGSGYVGGRLIPLLEQHPVVLRCLARNPDKLRPRVKEPTQIVQGDVLLTESTTEAFNILLPLLGAIVTDSGGLLSHSAIVAREYGIPGVVGTRDATQRIADGSIVRVDGDAGEVTVKG